MSQSQNGAGFESHGSDSRTVSESVDSNQPRPLSEDNDWAKQNILSLDGGGVRGYYSLLLLKCLMTEIKDEEQNRRDEEQEQQSHAQSSAHHGHLSSFSPCDEPRHVSHNPNGGPLFLPCHYFDYIGGTSTGALITIMLTTLRMTVEDCMEEYKVLAGLVFSRPRLLHHAGNPAGFIRAKNKYSTTGLENAIKDVLRRRGEQRNDHDDSMQFRTPKGLCRAIVLSSRNALRNGDQQYVNTPSIFRSYDNFKTQQSESSTARPRNPLSPRTRNPGRGTGFAAWKVARAATAAQLYFKPLVVAVDDGEVPPPRRSSTLLSNQPGRQRFDENTGPKRRETNFFTDAGFSRANNPSEEILHEVRGIFGSGPKKIANWVSIGTARTDPPEDTSTFIGILKRAVAAVGDPEVNHEYMTEECRRHPTFAYYRLNEVNGLPRTEMDEWKTRSGQASGSETINDMEKARDRWWDIDENRQMVRQVAKGLVSIRRARAADESKWERFALGRFFVCPADDCIYDTDQTWNYRAEFVQHLKTVHGWTDVEIENKVHMCSLDWEYKARDHYA